MCLYNRFTTFCRRWLNWNKSRVWARCNEAMLFSFRCRELFCPRFVMSRTTLIVVKFTFQIVRHASARGRDESLELYSNLWCDWRTSKQKFLRHGNRFVARVRRRYFVGGREATTRNAFAVRRLRCILFAKRLCFKPKYAHFAHSYVV